MGRYRRDIKMLKIRPCRKCHKEFESSSDIEDVCPACRKTLPECDSCHTKMSTEYGYMEDFARKVGNYSICGCCDGELENKEFLHITNFQYLMPDGSVKTKRR